MAKKTLKQNDITTEYVEKLKAELEILLREKDEITKAIRSIKYVIAKADLIRDSNTNHSLMLASLEQIKKRVRIK